jgi:hypothetical protein
MDCFLLLKREFQDYQLIQKGYFINSHGFLFYYYEYSFKFSFLYYNNQEIQLNIYSNYH